MFFNFERKIKMPTAADSLPGRDFAIPTSDLHFVNRKSLHPPYPENTELAMFGGGCFWGVERKYWQLEGVYITAAGYAGGYTPNPTYREVCSNKTGHNEVVRVVFHPAQISYDELLRVFWECHDPTQGMRQGNDVGTQYRSGIYTYGERQLDLAKKSKSIYQSALRSRKYGSVTTEIVAAGEFYFAEPEHQQYLAKNPGGYCGLGGTGVCYTPALDQAHH